MLALLGECDAATLEALEPLVELGLHHEQQHQELMVTDLKHAFASNPLRPVYRERAAAAPVATRPPGWAHFEAGLREIGHQGTGFSFDNEGPRHKEWLNAFALAGRLVTCGEYLQFMEDGGYTHPELWLSLGWSTMLDEAWEAPGYWEKEGGQWRQM